MRTRLLPPRLRSAPVSTDRLREERGRRDVESRRERSRPESSQPKAQMRSRRGVRSARVQNGRTDPDLRTPVCPQIGASRVRVHYAFATAIATPLLRVMVVGALTAFALLSQWCRSSGARTDRGR